MTKQTSARSAVFGGVVVAIAIAGAGLLAQTNQAAERFEAFAVNMSGVGPGAAGRVELVIDRWSSKAEGERLKQVFLEKGPDKLLDALQDGKRVGYIRTPTSLGWDVQFATQIPEEDGGRRIIVLTDRPVGFREAANMGRTMDYPFTLVEIHLDKNGVGEGKASVATKISLNKKTNTIELENYGQQPVMLTKVTAQKK
jgi:hypothetical protein